jgi:DNA-binding response OmpR family regulator
MMPEIDGIETCDELRKIDSLAHTLIVFLTARGEDYSQIAGFGAGADDYITKPFNTLELLARVKSQLRRYTMLGGMPGCQSDGVYTAGGLTVDNAKKTVTLDGEDVRLTPLEFKILLLFMRNPGRVFSIDEIYERVWGQDAMGGGSTVTVHIRRIREKIEINPGEPKFIKVVWGIGYKLERLDKPFNR